MEIHTIASFLEYYSKVRARTQKLMQVIPPQHMDWAYMPGKFTIADQIRHIAAIERYMFAETILGKPSCYTGCGKELADGATEVYRFFDEQHEASLAIFRQLSDTELQQKCRTPAGVSITVWKWLRAMTEHEIHHRAQLYLYLNMLHIPTPPMFGLSAEDIIRNSTNPQ